MRTDRHASITPNDDDMRAAWHQLAARDWPPLEELKRAAALYSLVRGAALRRASGLSTAVQTPAPAAPPPPQPTRVATAPPVPHHPPQLDHKRLAAGEREDD